MILNHPACQKEHVDNKKDNRLDNKYRDSVDAKRPKLLNYLQFTARRVCQSGGEDGPEIGPSPLTSGFLKFVFCQLFLCFYNDLTKVALELINLMHALVQDGDDPDVAVGKAFPVHEMTLMAEEEPFDAELGRDGTRGNAMGHSTSIASYPAPSAKTGFYHSV